MLVITTDAEITANGFHDRAGLVHHVSNRVVRENGHELLSLVKMATSGAKGGPAYRTGQYHDSIGLVIEAAGDMTTAHVGTDEEYGFQLELGGFIPDPETGEMIYHPPYPHFGIAMDYIEPDFIADLEREIGKFLS